MSEKSRKQPGAGRKKIDPREKKYAVIVMMPLKDIENSERLSAAKAWQLIQEGVGNKIPKLIAAKIL